MYSLELARILEKMKMLEEKLVLKNWIQNASSNNDNEIIVKGMWYIPIPKDI